jgi:hypothetical protein
LHGCDNIPIALNISAVVALEIASLAPNKSKLLLAGSLAIIKNAMEKISFLNNIWILIPFIVWMLVWKGIALWKAARRGEKVWFIIILILNTLGILEIIYIFLVSRKPRGFQEISSEPLKNENRVLDVKKI